jgi:hypothetical protein
MPVIPGIVVKDDPAVYHMSRVALDGYPLVL